MSFGKQSRIRKQINRNKSRKRELLKKNNCILHRKSCVEDGHQASPSVGKNVSWMRV